MRAGLLCGIEEFWSVTSCHELCSAGTGDGRSVESGCKTRDISFCKLGLRCVIRPCSRPRPWERMEESASGE